MKHDWVLKRVSGLPEGKGGEERVLPDNLVEEHSTECISHHPSLRQHVLFTEAKAR